MQRARACRQRRKPPRSGSTQQIERRAAELPLRDVSVRCDAARRLARAAVFALRIKQIADADPEQRQQEGDRAGHPHQHAGRRLIVEGRNPTQPRHLQIVRIQHDCARSVSQAASTVFCTSARSRYGNSSQRDQRGRLGYGRTTGYQNSSAAAKKAGVLDDVPASLAEPQLVAARRVPEPGRADVQRPRHERMREQCEDVCATGAERSSGATQYVRTARGRPRSNGNSGQPSQTSGGATIISSRCCSMWTCSKQRRERLDRRRQGQDRSPPARRGRRPAGRRASAAGRGDGATASRADRSPAEITSAAASQGANGQERRKASSVGLMAASLGVAVSARRERLRRRQPAGGWPSGRRLTRNATSASISAGLICLP